MRASERHFQNARIRRRARALLSTETMDVAIWCRASSVLTPKKEEKKSGFTKVNRQHCDNQHSTIHFLGEQLVKETALLFGGREKARTRH
jgi:hypothetical protein